MGGDKRWKWRTNCMRIVHFLPPELPGEEQKDLLWHWAEVEVTSATAFSCQGKLLKVLGRRIPEGTIRL
jgi:hypothetical protein